MEISQNFVAFSEYVNFKIFSFVTRKIESMMEKFSKNAKQKFLFIREFRKRSMYMDYTTAATL